MTFQRSIYQFNMEIIEVRLEKKSLIFQVILLAVFLIIFFFIIRSRSQPHFELILFVGVAGYITYIVQRPLRKFIRDEPILLFSDVELIVNDRKEAVSYLWEHIIAWEVKEGDEDTPTILRISTLHDCREIKLGMLEKSPEEIAQLVRKYKGA